MNAMATDRRTSPAVLTDSLVRQGFGRDVAEDAAQQALLVLHSKARVFESDEHCRNWLGVVARRAALRELSRRRREVPCGDTLGGRSEPDLALVVDARRALATLPPNRMVPLLAIASGWSYQELAVRLGRTYTWVNRGVSEGRALARRRLAA